MLKTFPLDLLVERERGQVWTSKWTSRMVFGYWSSKEKAEFHLFGWLYVEENPLTELAETKIAFPFKFDT